ncbi:hypothetical protein [Gracilimonas sp.]|uniref:hypothetical protein n=1 Tax=Gracilimonas sp. TaxID=1974203 RepID=UPI003BA9535B
MALTNIDPIVESVDKLYESDLKILLVMYHVGEWVEPKKLEALTGLHAKTINKSINRPRVKQLIRQIKKRDEYEQLFIRQKIEWQQLVEAKKKEPEVPK